MSKGYVYILSNKSLGNLLKIGRTELSPEERAKQLSSSSGLPDIFVVEFAIRVQNCVKVEKIMHQKLNNYRYNQKREFFEIDKNEAINMLRIIAEQEGKTTEEFESIEILGELQKKYSKSIRDDVISVKIYQTYDKVYLECVSEKFFRDDLRDQIIYRTDLGFVGQPEFLGTDPVELNASKYLSMDPYSYIICGLDKAFTKESIKKIVDEVEKNW